MISIDLFCGAGGMSTGIQWATGTSPRVAINHSEAAITCHRANHPEVTHYTEDVFLQHPCRVIADALKPRERLDLLALAPDCFAAGTLVLTQDGYVPIEQVRVGDKVWTHANRWRPVLQTMNSQKQVLRIHVQGHPDGLVCSRTHKHYATRSKGGELEKVPANELKRGCYIGSPMTLEEAKVPTDLPFSPWILGRFVADGWACPRSGIVLTVGLSKAESVATQLQHEKSNWTSRTTSNGSAIQFTTYSAETAQWLRNQFGHRAENKRLPGWIFTAPESFRREFLEGYVAGDGYLQGELTESSTVSRRLAIDVRTLVASLGFVVSAYAQAQTSNIIEGRRVHICETLYRVKWRKPIATSPSQQFERDGQRFYPVRKVEDLQRIETVYNLTVAEDFSYVVEGFTTWNCRHFSRAAGGVPVSESVRSLATVALQWVRELRDRAPRMILLENVPEFETWGPLHPSDHPDPRLRDRPISERKGEDFRAFVAELRLFGYRVEWKVLNCADYGAPTSRKRLFLIARRDDAPCWPLPTHGPGRAQPWQTAADHLNFDIPCPSIFFTKEEAKVWFEEVGRAAGWQRPPKRPIAEKTLARVAEGVRRYVLQNADPFLLTLSHGGRLRRIHRPLPTITTAHRGEIALVAPHLVRYHGQKRPGESRGALVEAPLPTQTTENRFALVSPVLTPNMSGNAPQSPNTPLPTITTGGRHLLVAAFLAKYFAGAVGQSLTLPAPTITSIDHSALVACHLEQTFSTCKGVSLEKPHPTILGCNHSALVACFLQKYYGASDAQGQDLDTPLHTITTGDRFGLVTVSLLGEPYVIQDIGMRMLTPEELKRCQGFPEDYILTGSTAEQVAHVGRSVPPPVVAALVAANLNPIAEAK